MRKMTILLVFAVLLLCAAGCQSPASTQSTAGESSTAEQARNREDEETMKISVKSADYEIIYELNNSNAAKTLYEQLPLTVEAEPFSNNEMTFYPPQKLDTSDTPLSSGEAGTLSYYSPWGDVVMFYDSCNPNGSLYGLGEVVSGKENIEKLSGTITVGRWKSK